MKPDRRPAWLSTLASLFLVLSLSGCEQVDVKALRVYFGLAPVSSLASENQHQTRATRLLPPVGRHRTESKEPGLDEGVPVEGEIPGESKHQKKPGFEPRSEHESGSTVKSFGKPCKGVDDSRYCLSLKYVAFHGSDGQDPEPAIEGINDIWAQCGILFQVDDYEVIDPSRYALQYDTADYEELDEIRERFQNDHSLLVVATGEWDRSGSLGDSWANAWTYLPGARYPGVVLERNVADSAGIVAHELGHSLGLDHLDDGANVMHPVIYERSRKLTRPQCDAAKDAIEQYWLTALR